MVSLPAPLTASWRQRCSAEISSEYESGDSPNEWAMVARTGPAQSASLVVLRGMAINGDWCAMVFRGGCCEQAGQWPDGCERRHLVLRHKSYAWSSLVRGLNVSPDQRNQFETGGQARQLLTHTDIVTSRRKDTVNNNKSENGLCWTCSPG